MDHFPFIHKIGGLQFLEKTFHIKMEDGTSIRAMKKWIAQNLVTAEY